MENTQVKSGIDAPENVIISREEVYTKIVWVWYETVDIKGLYQEIKRVVREELKCGLVKTKR